MGMLGGGLTIFRGVEASPEGDVSWGVAVRKTPSTYRFFKDGKNWDCFGSCCPKSPPSLSANYFLLKRSMPPPKREAADSMPELCFL